MMSRMRLRPPRRGAFGLAWLAAGCCLAMSSCSRSAVKTVPVRGQITYGGGDWPSTGMVIFAPKQAAEGYPRRAGQSLFEKNGRFEASTFEPRDGLIPGTYMVNIRCFEASPEDITKGINHVPEKFRRGETSGFEVVVPADDSQPVIANFDVPQGQ